jgi:hypothetical protein
MIDFTNPDALTNHGERIPVDTQEKLDAVREAATAVYTMAGVPWDDDAEQQLEARVLNGQTVEEIITHTLEDRKARFEA